MQKLQFQIDKFLKKVRCHMPIKWISLMVNMMRNYVTSMYNYNFLPFTQDPFAFRFRNDTWRVSCVQHFVFAFRILIIRSWNFNNRRFHPLIKMRGFFPAVFCFTGSGLLQHTTTILSRQTSLKFLEIRKETKITYLEWNTVDLAWRSQAAASWRPRNWSEIGSWHCKYPRNKFNTWKVSFLNSYLEQVTIRRPDWQSSPMHLRQPQPCFRSITIVARPLMSTYQE